MKKKERSSNLPKFLKGRKLVKKPKENAYYWKVSSATNYQPQLIKMGLFDIDRENPGCFGFSYPNNIVVDMADKNIVVGIQFIGALGNLNCVKLFSATKEEIAKVKAQYFLLGLEDATRQIKSSCQ